MNQFALARTFQAVGGLGDSKTVTRPGRKSDRGRGEAVSMDWEDSGAVGPRESKPDARGPVCLLMLDLATDVVSPTTSGLWLTIG